MYNESKKVKRMSQKIGYSEKVKEVIVICHEQIMPTNDDGSKLILKKEYWTKDGQFIGSLKTTNLKIDI